jgi:hypothetical protein
VNAAGEGERLPQSIGGLIDLALADWRERAALYLGLAFAMFAVCGAVEFLFPGTSDDGKDIKSVILPFVELFGLAIVVAAAALSVGARVAGEPLEPRALLRGALARWFAVFGTMLIVQLVVIVTAPYSGIFALPDPPLLAVITAPPIWLLWGALNLAGPVAALSAERPAIAIFVGFARAVVLSLRRENLGRLCVLAFATVVPTLLASVLFDIFTQRHVAHSAFWSNLPVDALTVAPVAAIQTAFVLDFARRAGAQRSA